MAVILVLAGSLLGFVAGAVSIFAFDASLLQGLGIWTGTGLLATCLGLTQGRVVGDSDNPQLETA